MSKIGGSDSKNPLYCSFCGKSQNEVRKLIAGPTVFICNECVELCLDIIGEETQMKTVGRMAATDRYSSKSGGHANWCCFVANINYRHKMLIFYLRSLRLASLLIRCNSVERPAQPIADARSTSRLLVSYLTGPCPLAPIRHANYYWMDLSWFFSGGKAK